jgi:putative PIN family toxin of toxin-antitoxin system
MLKVVFDTNVLVSALWTPGGNPAKIIALMPLGALVPCYSYAIMKEYRAVLNRPKLRFSGSKTHEILAAIEKYGMPLIVEASSFPMTDETDRVFYDVARASQSYLITGSAKHFPPTLFIVSPADFLGLVGGKNIAN